MPVKQIVPHQATAAQQQLLGTLVDEWQRPQSGRTQPIIVEQHDAAKRLTHVYVIWDDWDSLRAEDRADVVLEAAQKVKGPAALDIYVAMGLTRIEADRLRIPYQKRAPRTESHWES